MNGGNYSNGLLRFHVNSPCVEFKISYYTGPSRVLAKRMKKTERVWQHLNSDNMALLHHGIHENDKKVTLNMRTDL
jgi:hypothetical protein